METKICTKCGKKKALTEFSMRKERRKLRNDCRQCQNKQTRISAKKRQEANPELFKQTVRERSLKFNYGITLYDYNKLLVLQDGRCAICGTTQPGHYKPFYIDHDHNTDKIRGLLCRNCNLMLGHAQDDPGILKQAARYLETNK
jgi:hypothetical protein